MSEFATERIARVCRCGGCGGTIGRLNIMSLERRATWQYPTAGNLVTHYGPCAVAVVCDACIDAQRDPREAIELAGEGVVYHPLESLEQLPPEPTAVIYPDERGQRVIHCLRCGRTSWHADDVLNHYCGCCGEFHKAVQEKPQDAKG